MAALAVSFLAPLSPVRAGSYQMTSQTGGQISSSPGSPMPRPYASGVKLPDGGTGYGGSVATGGAGSSASCAGSITTVYTWQRDGPSDIPPLDVVVIQDSSASWNGYGPSAPTGSCSDGIGDQEHPTSGPGPSPNTYAAGGSSSGTHYTVQAGGDTVTVTCPAQAQASGTGGPITTSVAYSVQIYPIIVTPAGATIINGKCFVLTGQRITASLGTPFPVDQATFQWTVNGAGYFKNYDPSLVSNQFVIHDAGDYKTATFGFYTKLLGDVTVSCSATVIAPDGTRLPVSATRTISSVKPACSNWDIVGGDVTQVTNGFQYTELGGGGSGQIWTNVRFSAADPFSGSQGSGCFAQLITPDRLVKRNTSTHSPPYKTTIVYPEPNATPKEGLDVGFPYPYSGQWSQPAAGSGSDAPIQPYIPAVSNDDGGGTDYYESIANDSFKTTLMYRPQSIDSQIPVWIPIDIHVWSWYGDAKKSGSVWSLPDRNSDPNSTHIPTDTHPTWGRVHPSPFNFVLGAS